MTQTDFVKNNFVTFKGYSGSQHIATFSSQLNFIEALVLFSPKTVCDYGSGIGTFLPLIAQYSDAQIFAVEKNGWCKTQLTKNISSLPKVQLQRIKVMSSLPGIDFEVVVIDDALSKREIRQILRSQSLSLIFIEGFRHRTVGQVSKRLISSGYQAQFVWGECRLQDRVGSTHSNHECEKAGSFFFLSRAKIPGAVVSWLLRICLTEELVRFFTFPYRTTKGAVKRCYSFLKIRMNL